jgi:hypothetical protein
MNWDILEGYAKADTNIVQEIRVTAAGDILIELTSPIYETISEGEFRLILSFYITNCTTFHPIHPLFKTI